MDFQFVVEHVDLGKAILIFEDRLPADFWENLSFEQAKDILYQVSPETTVWHKAYERAIAKATSGKDWYWIWAMAKHQGELIPRIKPMMPIWKRFEDWDALLGGIPWGEEYLWCLMNMAKTACEFSHWGRIHEAAGRDSEFQGYYWKEKELSEEAKRKCEEVRELRFAKAGKLREQAFQEMQKTAQTYSEWNTVESLARVHKQERMHHLAFDRMFDLSGDLSLRDLVWLYLDFPCCYKKYRLFERVRQFEASFDEWIYFAEGHHRDDSQLKALALTKVDKLGTRDQWLTYLKEHWDWGGIYEEVNNHATQRLLGLAGNVSQLVELLPFRRDEKELLLFQRMAEIARTPEDWCALLKFTYRSTRTEQHAQFAIRRLREMATS